ncbi:probable N2,N2-dimethylguanosine tRNA methyltransferase [Rhynchosporium secalis]|uniref:tRNA (guanine(26)-N(2))-dimethyltransferase n=1 Tax=Rhynchosporium secalis TaxID=38038 RepID=A0A1E1MWH3_RHYSE|nr:probable N2,N2-dimethylguanosine tRNA methyltransferase [Rhynchosporium secalis]
MASSSLPDLSATPAVGQHLLHEGKEYTTVQEGLAHILVPASGPAVPQATPKGENSPQMVFYNPIQQFNRDLSVLAIKAYGEEVLEMKQKAVENHKLKLEAKSKEKKRKREEEGLGDFSRKAGKIEGNSTPVEEAPKENGDSVMKNEEAQPVETESHGPSTTSATVPEANASSIASTTPREPVPTKPDPPLTTDDTSEQQPKFAFTILDALSATGLRALRYSHEIPIVTSVTANDLLPEATKTIKMNIKHNQLENKIKATTSNAMAHMYSLIGQDCKNEKGRSQPSMKYNVIDLDPYGTAAPFLDAAVQAVRDDGGLLCVTCTDAGVWASNGYPEKAFSLYGGTTIKGPQSHEGGLRLILHAIATSASRYGMAMEPLLSLSIDFYARVFVRIYKSPADVKFLAGKTMVVYNCDSGCGAWTTQTVGKNKLIEGKKGGCHWKHVYGQGPSVGENCKHCGYRTHFAGPMYAGPIHDPVFIKRILDRLPNASEDIYQTKSRIEGMLNVAMEECIFIEEDPNSPTSSSKTGKWDPAALDPAPFLFVPSVLSKVIHCVTPIENSIRGALRGLGYLVTRSHTKPGSIKTNAPWEVIWEVMREWTRQKEPIKEGANRAKTAGYTIMGLGKPEDAAQADGVVTEEKIKVVFDEKLGAEKDKRKLVRYQLNPRENWGPMARAKGHA